MPKVAGEVGANLHFSGNATNQAVPSNKSHAAPFGHAISACSCHHRLSVLMKQSHESNHPISPYSIYKGAALFKALFGIVRSGISPTEFDSKTWYDRTIRIVGGVVLFIVFVAGLALIIADQFKHSM
jgi:hypothetical protein